MLRRAFFAILFCGVWVWNFPAQAQEASLKIRGQNQTVHLYGARGDGPIAIVSSGDAGWFGLGPKLAEFLFQQGYFVVGFSSKAYLESFTGKTSHLTAADVPKDYATLIDWAAQGAKDKPILIGVSEGAGLSVLAATGPEVQGKVAGVLALGLPEENELAWRTRDAVIWFTKKVPNEPTFHVRDIISQVGVPLAVLHSTRDEFVSVEDERQMFALAKEPKKLWELTAKNHSFGGNHSELNQTVLEAIAWIGNQAMNHDKTPGGTGIDEHGVLLRSKPDPNAPKPDPSLVADDASQLLFYAGALLGDPAIQRRVWRQLNLTDAAGAPTPRMTEFIRAHQEWVKVKADVAQTVATPAKARAYLASHLN